ncbi:thiol reductant ABC exporter subunit CydC [Labrenzia sp. PHM005]|uniref:thiol reductant ABC exporter subunit CydC n=1 Tax=Labrenzia sp. PHM005 TaxID=2590016 RepID=UPI0011402B86|nr:thiol reductant ABC exporter subunit CydC [Labrenzia sp. PHM005]QDG77938.1 thiol reductant ABC exporter subunit CydC [Labrenzia sp. PHM005]
MTAIWTFICRQYRHNRLSFCLGIMAALIPAISGLLLLGVAGWFITVAGIAGATGIFLNIFVPSAMIRALAISRTAGRYAERLLTHDATFRFLSDLRNKLFSAMVDRSARGQRSGLLLNRLTVDIAALDGIYLRLVVPFAVIAVVSVGLIAVWLSMPMIVAISGTMFLAIWAGLAVFAARTADVTAARRADAASEAMRLRATDMVSGRRDLSVFGGLAPVAETIVTADTRQGAAEDIEERRSVRLTCLSTAVGQVFVAVMLIAVAAAVSSADLSPGLAIGLVLAAIAVPEVFGSILPGLIKLPRMELAANRTNNLLEKDTVATPRKTPVEERFAPEIDQSQAILKFDSVSFRYPGAERDVLDNLSFEIGEKETLAIAGRSGCGKSTVAALGARLRSAGQGRILLNGRDLSGIPETELRSKVTVLSQRPHLFNDTVAANLRIANPAATDTELWIALAQAAVAQRISESPDGLETVLGEGGLGLSGGEQRRLALARAFLTSPDLFILDEMTEGLDADTTIDVLERFFSFRGRAAVLMIAHKRIELESAGSVLFLNQRKLDLAAE